MFLIIKKIKNFDIEEYIKNLWKKIDSVDKKTFFILFVLMNIVYLYNSIYCLFGSWAIYAMFEELPLFVELFCGRFSTSFFEYFISNKTIIPLYINILLFFFLSLSMVLLLNWFKVKKILYIRVLLGIFTLMSPFLYSIIFFRTECFGHLMALFIVIISLIWGSKIGKENNCVKTFFSSFLLIFLLTVFVLGAYQPIIFLLCGLLLSKIFIEYIESDLSNFLEIILKYKFLYIVIFLSSLLYLFIYKSIIVYGVDTTSYNTLLVNIEDLFKNIYQFFIKVIKDFLFDTYPYLGVFYKRIFLLLIIFSILSVLIYKQKIFKTSPQKVLFLICFYIFVLLTFNLGTLFSPVLLWGPKYMRLEYYTTIPFIFICTVISFKYANDWIRRIIIVILFFLSLSWIQITFAVQKDQMLGQEVELNRVLTLKQLIMGNKNFHFSDEEEYNYIQIGEFDNIGNIETYNGNEYSNNSFGNLMETFLDKEIQGTFFYSLVAIPPKIKIDSNRVDKILSAVEMEKYINDNMTRWLQEDAKAFPSPNSIYIEDNKIFVIINEKFLEKIKFDLKNNKL